MSHAPETYDYVANYEDWIEVVEALTQRMPLFASVDLIIEGCISGNEWCAYWVSKALPKSIYVGTDIAPHVRTLTQERVDNGISKDLYTQLLVGQAQLRTDLGDSAKVTLRANCMSHALIDSLKQLSDAKTTMLVTFNGLVALMGQDYNPGERKNLQDITPPDQVITSDLFDLQLHILENERSASLWDLPINIMTHRYHQAEKIAQDSQLQAIRIKDGLLITK